MNDKQKQDSVSQDLNTTQEVKTESKEASETASAPFEFFDEPEVQEEVIEAGDTTVVFKEEVPSAHEGAVGGDFWNADEDWMATVIGSTPEGKEVQVMKRQGGQGYEVHFRQGGERPVDIQGWFTSYDKAEQAARAYLNRRYETA